MKNYRGAKSLFMVSGNLFIISHISFNFQNGNYDLIIEFRIDSTSSTSFIKCIKRTEVR